VLAGANFPVQQIDLDDFSFIGRPLRPQIQVGVAVQATAGEFVLDVLPERFQVAVMGSTPTPDKIAALQQACRTFIQEYAGRKGIIAVGHNFQGAAVSNYGSGADLLERLAWSEALNGVLSSDIQPALSLSIRFRRGFETSTLLQLEAASDDPARFLYSLNFNFSMSSGAHKFSVAQALDSFDESLKAGTQIIEGLVKLEAEDGGGTD
jgi:hypothetical protein